MRKAGGGAHNWGTLEDQLEGEIYDDEDDVVPVHKSSMPPVDAAEYVGEDEGHMKDRRASVSTASTGTASEDKEKAVEYRAKALKAGDRESRFCSLILGYGC